MKKSNFLTLALCAFAFAPSVAFCQDTGESERPTKTELVFGSEVSPNFDFTVSAEMYAEDIQVVSASNCVIWPVTAVKIDVSKAKTADASLEGDRRSWCANDKGSFTKHLTSYKLRKYAPVPRSFDPDPRC